MVFIKDNNGNQMNIGNHGFVKRYGQPIGRLDEHGTLKDIGGKEIGRLDSIGNLKGPFGIGEPNLNTKPLIDPPKINTNPYLDSLNKKDEDDFKFELPKPPLNNPIKDFNNFNNTIGSINNTKSNFFIDDFNKNQLGIGGGVNNFKVDPLGTVKDPLNNRTIGKIDPLNTFKPIK